LQLHLGGDQVSTPNWLTDKQINVILQSAWPSIPSCRTAIGRRSCARRGVAQIFTLAFGAQKMAGPVTTTPGVPPERLAALRRAFDATMRDRDFQDDAKRNGLEADGPITGAEVDDVLHDIYATPKRSCSATRRSETSDRFAVRTPRHSQCQSARGRNHNRIVRPERVERLDLAPCRRATAATRLSPRPLPEFRRFVRADRNA